MENEHLCPGCFNEKGTASVCPACGYDESLERSPILLPHRTLLNEQYLIGKVLGKPGGFGITYLAWDLYLQTYVAIKEFLPRDLAGRVPGGASVQPHTNDDSKLFSYGLEQFINEARTLAQFDHPNVVRVKTFFKGFNTAYMVMDYYDGVSLNEYIVQKGQPLSETVTLGIMYPILDGLHEVHNKGFLHRDIKPHNIFLTTSKRVILLDFGAARVSMNERSKSMSVVLTPGFAPPEQYHGRGKQGPWTDIYAVAATMYYMLTGSVPAEATERLYEDQLEPVNALNRAVSEPVSRALNAAMAIRAEDRPQTIPTFQALLAGSSVPDAVYDIPKTKASEVPVPPTVKASNPTPMKAGSSGGGSGKWIGIAAGVLLAVAAGWWFMQGTSGGDLQEPLVQVDTPYRNLIDEGRAAFDRNDYDAAESSWRAAAALRPDSTTHVSLLARVRDSVAARNERLEYARRIAALIETRQEPVREQPRTQTPTPAQEPARPAATPVQPFSYRNDFNGSSSEFPSRSAGAVNISFGNGRLRYANTQQGGMSRTTPALNVSLTSDFTAETASRFTDSSTPSQQIGLVFGEGTEGFHYFALDDEGDIFVARNSGGSWTMLLNYTRSEAVRRGNLMNTFKVEKRGTRYTFYLNTIQVHQQTIASLDGNRFGIGVAGVTSAEFDYFQLTGTQP